MPRCDLRRGRRFARGGSSATSRGTRLEIRIAAARRLTKTQRAGLDAEVARIAAFTGLEPVVAVE